MRWMNLEPIIQSEVCQKQKNKYCILIHTYEKKKDSDFDSGKIIVHRLGKVRFWLVKTIIEIQAHWGRSKALKYNVCSGLFPSKRCVCMRCETLLKAFPFLAKNCHYAHCLFAQFEGRKGGYIFNTVGKTSNLTLHGKVSCRLLIW